MQYMLSGVTRELRGMYNSDDTFGVGGSVTFVIVADVGDDDDVDDALVRATTNGRELAFRRDLASIVLSDRTRHEGDRHDLSNNRIVLIFYILWGATAGEQSSTLLFDDNNRHKGSSR
jgi:hypothetical protein